MNICKSLAFSIDYPTIILLTNCSITCVKGRHNSFEQMVNTCPLFFPLAYFFWIFFKHNDSVVFLKTFRETFVRVWIFDFNIKDLILILKCICILISSNRSWVYWFLWVYSKLFHSSTPQCGKSIANIFQNVEICQCRKIRLYFFTRTCRWVLNLHENVLWTVDSHHLYAVSDS